MKRPVIIDELGDGYGEIAEYADYLEATITRLRELLKRIDRWYPYDTEACGKDEPGRINHKCRGCETILDIRAALTEDTEGGRVPPEPNHRAPHGYYGRPSF